MSDRKMWTQALALVIVSSLLVLTAWDNAVAMFWCSVTAMLVLLVWFSIDQKALLATIAGAFIALVIPIFLSLN